MTTMRVVATEPELQGPYVVIEEEDYDPSIHTPYEETKPRARAAASVAVKTTFTAKKE